MWIALPLILAVVTYEIVLGVLRKRTAESGRTQGDGSPRTSERSGRIGATFRLMFDCEQPCESAGGPPHTKWFRRLRHERSGRSE